MYQNICLFVFLCWAITYSLSVIVTHYRYPDDGIFITSGVAPPSCIQRTPQPICLIIDIHISAKKGSGCSVLSV
jgi:hypothetical protein